MIPEVEITDNQANLDGFPGVWPSRCAGHPRWTKRTSIP
jgi:hypothetical protein